MKFKPIMLTAVDLSTTEETETLHLIVLDDEGDAFSVDQEDAAIIHAVFSAELASGGCDFENALDEIAQKLSTRHKLDLAVDIIDFAAVTPIIFDREALDVDDGDAGPN